MERENQDDQNQLSEPSNDSLETPQETQQTAPPTDPRTDPRYVQLIEETMRENVRRTAEMEREIRELRANREAPVVPKSKEELRQEFYDNPHEATRNIIRAEMNDQIAPLTEFVRGFRSQNRVDQLIAEAKQNPRYAAQWGPRLERYIREQAEQVAPQGLDQAFNFIVVSAIGLKATGQIAEDNAASPAQVAPVPNNAPAPYMRPSSPNGPDRRVADPNAPARPLTETELRVLREFNAGRPASKRMTEKQYLDWQSVPARDVATSEIGRPPKAGN